LNGDFRKPSRLEALPMPSAMPRDKTRKRVGTVLNTMGTF
jgi:hypothetical protein